MNFARHLSLMWHCFRLGVMQTMQEKILFLGIFFIYATIMVIFAGVIRLIPSEDLEPMGLTHDQMIWYLATTEYVVFTISGWMFKEVQNDISSGQADLSLIRPVSDSMVRTSIWMGQSFARAAALFPAYLFFMYIFVGKLVFGPLHIVGLVLSIPLGTYMLLVASYFIGGSCLWFVQAEPASWLWQKCVFLFGAMLWPLCFYPEWLQSLVWFTPFPSILMIVGNWTLDLPWWRYVLAFVHQIVWVCVFFFLLGRFDRVVLRRIQSGEGA